MLIQDIERQMELQLELTMGSDAFEKYTDSVIDCQLYRAEEDMRNYSYAGSRDGDRIEVTVNKPYEREIIEAEDDMPAVYGTNVYDQWIITDVPDDENIYHLTLVSDSTSLDEEIDWLKPENLKQEDLYEVWGNEDGTCDLGFEINGHKVILRSVETPENADDDTFTERDKDPNNFQNAIDSAEANDVELGY